MDFTHDPDDFVAYISSVKRDWTRASSDFLGLVEHWRDLSEQSFANISSVSTEGNSIKGEVLGKLFTIELSPIAEDQIGYAQAVLLSRKVGNAQSEIGRFRIRRDGSIVDIEGTTVVNGEDNHYSYKVFTSVLRAVIEAPATVVGQALPA
ncbi:hypothetical protein [Pseudomonas sp. QTF5]|uniref:hypothetical protein n=1 Tax=Pseudomonas sp. QTF5 TaxID=1435425 RepID=UPI0004BE4287|nr:hypothetical protein [Pseudomonas sp. QTF5]